ncbi:MAG: lytic transglycosylase domain-containing protein [Myxococcota bacterium]
MPAALRPLLGLALLWGLSVSLFGDPSSPPSAPAPPRARPAAAEPQGPGPVEYVLERILRYQSGLAPFEIRRAAETIVEESARWGLDRDLVLAVIHTESGFYNFAVSRVGALGLMQIMPATGRMLAKEMGLDWRREILFDPVTNVRMGTRYLAHLHRRYEDWGQALAAYNWGPQHIDRRLRTGRALPVSYSRQVMAQLESPPLTP